MSSASAGLPLRVQREAIDVGGVPFVEVVRRSHSLALEKIRRTGRKVTGGATSVGHSLWYCAKWWETEVHRT